MTRNYVTGINPANAALRFIDQRLASPNYRGGDSSQQNRYKVETVATVLTLLNNHLDNNGIMQIRTTDCSKRPENTPEEYQYAMFCHEAKIAVGIGTQDAMRKNLFVDWHRMGLISRFGVDGQPTDPYGRSSVKYVGLTDLGRRFITAQNIAERQYLFSKALNTLLGGFIEDVMNLLDSTDTIDINGKINYLDFDEFMFFVTAIGAEDFGIDIPYCKYLIQEWRVLTHMNKSSVKNKLREQLVPNLYNTDKSGKRDWHNWINKNQQMWYLFGQVSFFIVEGTGTQLRLYSTAVSPQDEMYDKSKLKRSARAKTDYFKNHNVQKRIGFELDHIVPLLEANNIHDFHYLDSWENLIYVDAFTHAIKSQRGSKHKILWYEADNPNNIALIDHNNDYIAIMNSVQGIFNPKHVPFMQQYNSSFLNKPVGEWA